MSSSKQLNNQRCTADEGSFVAILKVHGGAIHLKNHDENLSVSRMQSFRIFCHDLDNQSDPHLGSQIQVFVLSDSLKASDRSSFQAQKLTGEPINNADLTIFMSPPYDSARKASFAIDLGISTHSTSLEDLSNDDCRKLGTAYIYLDPKFSTQGIQRMQIIAAYSFAPIGHMEVEYLIVKNPLAYGVAVRIPKWLSQKKQIDQGHRGAGSGCRRDLPGSIIENTVASFNYAARHGADMCELDVLCTADGIPVVHHDYKLDIGGLKSSQVDQLTLDELRQLTNIRIHDKTCDLNKDSDISHNTQSVVIPTLEQVLKEVDRSCALNIELKWAQLMANGKYEATLYREINDFVDRVLSCIDAFSEGRQIVLSTLNADIAIMLRLKQAQYPVLFLTTGDSNRFNDPATKSVKNAIHFAKAFDMAGINPNAAYLSEYLVRYAQDRGLLVYAWGKIETPQTIRELRRFGLNGVIYDKIDLIKPQD